MLLYFGYPFDDHNIFRPTKLSNEYIYVNFFLINNYFFWLDSFIKSIL